jgi:WD40 repeat protein
MGVVYKARQVSLNRIVALKMILAGVHADADARARFRREAEAVAALQHPNIIQIYEIGEAGGHLYLALEYVEGGNLATYLQRGPWPVHLAAELTLLLAQATQYAHTQGVIHRDLKPANVLLRRVQGSAAPTLADPPSQDGITADLPSWPSPRDLEPKITDFGLAKRLEESGSVGTRSGAVMGTPSYIAPEQAAGRNREIGPAVDIYALGAILYELLTGRPPFLGESPLDIILQVLHDEPVPPRRLRPGIPLDLETICLKCLEKQPSRRYASAAALAEDLRRFLQGEPIQARPLSGPERLTRWIRRHPVWSALAAVTVTSLLILLIGLTTAYLQVRDAVRQREAEAEAARLARQDEAQARQEAERLALENAEKRREAEESNARLKREIEERRRSSYALQLTQIATVVGYDPSRAAKLLEDPQRCPPDLRDFTWAYLHRLCQRQAVEYHHREARPLLRPEARPPLRAVAWAPRGSFVASGDERGQVHIWDPHSGRTWLAGPAHSGRITALAFTPDEAVLVTAGDDGAIRLWELPVLLLQQARRSLDLLPPLRPLVGSLRLRNPVCEVFRAHEGEVVTALAVSPDGRWLVSGAADGTLRWWNLAAVHLSVETPIREDPTVWSGLFGSVVPFGQITRHSDHLPLLTDPPIPAHKKREERGVFLLSGVTSLCFAWDGADRSKLILASGGTDGRICVWEGDGSRLRVAYERSASILAVALSPDGQHLAFTDSGPTHLIWLLHLGKKSDTIRRLSGHTATIYSLAFSPDGESLASGSFDRTVRLWDLTGQERAVLHGHQQSVVALAFSPDRMQLISASTDGTARLWWTQPQRCDSAELSFKKGVAEIITASADGRVILMASREEPGEIVTGFWPLHLRDRFRLWQPPFPLRVKDQNRLRPRIHALVLTPNGRQALASVEVATETGMESQLILWQRTDERGRREPRFQNVLAFSRDTPVRALTFDPAGRTVALLDADGLWLWDLPPRDLLLQQPGLAGEVARPRHIYRPEKPPRECIFDPSGRYLALAVEHLMLLLDRDGRVLVQRQFKKLITGLGWGGPQGEWLAVAQADGLVQVWNWRDAERTLNWQADITGHDGAVYALAFSPNGRTLASGGHDRVVLLSDPQTGQERLRLTGHSEQIIRLQFLPQASALLSFARDGGVKYWPARRQMLSP